MGTNGFKELNLKLMYSFVPFSLEIKTIFLRE